MPKSRSPSLPHPQRPIRPSSSVFSPNTDAMASSRPGSPRVGSLGPPISSPVSESRKVCHESSPYLAAASVIAIVIVSAASSASAQLIVFDPNNYAQNVLTAARALQQVNNQISSLQNQARCLINQASNLASLPYSSLPQLQQSIERTRQLLAQAQRIAYDVKQIDQAFSTTYAPASASASDQVLIANAQTRWQNSVAGLQDALRVQATVVGNLDTNRTQIVGSDQFEPVRDGGAAGSSGRQSAPCSAGAAARRPDRSDCCAGAGAKSRNRPARRRPGSGKRTASSLSHSRPRLPTLKRADVSPMSGFSGFKRLLFAATVAVVPTMVVAACAIQLRGNDDPAPAGSSVTQAHDPVAAELERCRTVISEQAADIWECRRVWAENRRRFLGHRKAPAAPSVDAQPNVPPLSSAPPKGPGRVLGGRSPVTTPKSE